jgi:trimethylamine---corrinoid protein Co-methyltransferase
MIESGVTMDLGQLVIDNELIAMIRQFVAGVPVNDETLAVDEINDVGARGEYLSREHTLRHMAEASRPKLFDRRVREAWLALGASDLATRARGEATRVIAEHQVEPLPEEVTAELRQIVERADRETG